MKSRWSSSTSIACRRALSIMNSVRVLPRIAAASSISCRILGLYTQIDAALGVGRDRTLRLPRRPQRPRLCEREERAFGMPEIVAPRIHNVNTNGAG